MPKSDQGIQLNRYKTIPRSLVFIFREEEVLLLKGAPTKRIWANLYNGVGGHVERGESVLASAHKELFEESGLSGIELWLTAVIMVDASDDIGICIFVFQGEFQEGELTPSEEGSLHWIPIHKINDYPLVEDLYELLPVIHEMKRGQQPLFLRYRYNEQGKLIIDHSES